jgi:hypothetical protein
VRGAAHGGEGCRLLCTTAWIWDSGSNGEVRSDAGRQERMRIESTPLHSYAYMGPTVTQALLVWRRNVFKPTDLFLLDLRQLSLPWI